MTKHLTTMGGRLRLHQRRPLALYIIILICGAAIVGVLARLHNGN